jgi:hypothetical protein
MTIILLTVIFSMFNFTTPPQASQLVTGYHELFGVDRLNRSLSDSVVGEISDSHCRFKHMDGMESDETCVHHCRASGGKAVLIDRENNLVYTLDAEGEKQAAKYAAKRVRMTGHVMDKMIHVEKIEAAE